MEEIRSEALRRELRRLLDEIQHDGAHVTVLRYDTPVAVIVPMEWYRDMVSKGGEPDAS